MRSDVRFLIHEFPTAIPFEQQWGKWATLTGASQQTKGL